MVQGVYSSEGRNGSLNYTRHTSRHGEETDTEQPSHSRPVEPRFANPPWQWEAPPKRARIGTREYPECELLARARKRLALTRGSTITLTTVKVTPDKEKLASMTKLKAARKRVKELGAAVRDEAFDDWHSKCVVIAQNPGEWTQAAVLYASYIKHAARYGNNRGDKALAKEELATETAWGRMMAGVSIKKRRRAGQYYPLRLKRGA